jgi:hypothetical protein
MQKIYNLQQELWIPHIPPDITKLTHLSNNHSYLAKSLHLINQYQFNLDLTINSNIIGGSMPIHNFLKEKMNNVHGPNSITRWKLFTFMAGSQNIQSKQF